MDNNTHTTVNVSLPTEEVGPFFDLVARLCEQHPGLIAAAHRTVGGGRTAVRLELRDAGQRDALLTAAVQLGGV